MSAPADKLSEWRQVLRRQSAANIKRWLAQIKESDDPATLIIENYDNLLRALENNLHNPDAFDLSFQLITSLHTAAIDYADLDRWLHYLEKALQTAETLGLDMEHAKLLSHVGDIHYRTGDLHLAEKLYKKGADKSKSVGDLSGYASTLAVMAVVADLQGQTGQGVALCRKALEIAGSINDLSVLGRAYLNLSNIHRRAHNWRPGLKAATDAFNIYQKLGKKLFVHKAQQNMVAIWAELGQWEQVDAISEQLIKALSAAGDIRTLSQLKNNLGLVAFRQKKYVLAEAAWQEALQLHSQIQEPAEQASLYNNLGVVYTRMGEWQAAQEMLEKA
ncbi:MAG: tetratricopeptide repeat protein, partial [Anaerolineae bacterium]